MKLILLKLVLAVLASLGIFFGPRIHVQFCYPGKTATSSAPTNCEHVLVRNVSR